MYVHGKNAHIQNHNLLVHQNIQSTAASQGHTGLFIRMASLFFAITMINSTIAEGDTISGNQAQK